MKTKFCLLMLLAACALFTSCEQEGNATLVGEWHATIFCTMENGVEIEREPMGFDSAYGDYVFNFKKDICTWAVYEFEGADAYIWYEGKYMYYDNTIFLTDMYEGMAPIELNVVAISKTSMILDFPEDLEMRLILERR